MAEEPQRICLIAGRGGLPNTVLAALEKQNRDFKTIAIKGNQEGHDFQADRTIGLDKWGQFRESFDEWNINAIVFAGKVDRPNLHKLRPDFTLVRYLPKLGLSSLGDDGVMQRLLAIFAEDFNLKILSIQEILAQEKRPIGALGHHEPDHAALSDIRRGIEILQITSAADFGQAVAVAGGVVLGLEAIEGTDNLIERTGQYRIEAQGGVIVKLPKTQQDHRIDAPTIGLETIHALENSKFSGIAISAKDTIIVDEKAVIDLANQFGLFIYVTE